MLYFAYGSNMSSLRLQSRVQSARPLETARLTHHQLLFHKASLKDGSAKCDAHHTGMETDYLFGVVYEIAAHERRILDQYEGLGCGYEIKQVMVELNDGSAVQAFSYYATEIDPELRPYVWYHQHVLIGAREHKLPDAYISAHIESIQAIPDPDTGRHADELAIYLS